MAEHPEKLCSALFLHNELGIPHQYLRQLLTSLSKSGFIQSVRGREGGFILSKPIDKIYLADIIDSIEGLDVFSTCIMGFNECPFDNKCAMHETWMKTRDDIINILKSTSLADFRVNKT
jgi:Rrf2 family protein